MTYDVLKKNPTLNEVVDVTSLYIGFADFPKKEDGTYPKPTVEIERLEQHNVPRKGSRIKDVKNVLFFKGKKRGLIVAGKGKKTKCGMLLRAFGEPKNWIGKKIKIIPNPAASYGGEVTGGLNIEIVK